ncbi:MAG: glycosyltransferase family 39 protein [Gemmatimonadetes bacterium]|nr:glycosyltransferase family 39 protein [Gemmatimonadota bacterium]
MSRAFGLVLLLSGLLKVALALHFADLAPRYDEVEFLDLGRRMAEGAAPHPFRAPGYQAFVSIGLRVANGDPAGVRVLQALLSTLTCFLAYRTARRLFGERAALAAGSFLAFYPSLVAYSHLLWAETLFLTFSVGAFDRLLAADQRSCPKTAAFAGLLLGVGALVRSMALPLAAATIVWWALRDSRRLALGLAFAAGVALPVLPWSMWASAQAGRPVLVDTNGGYNLFSGNNEWIPPGLPGIWSLGLALQNGTEEARASWLATQRGIQPRAALLRPEGEWRFDVAARLRDAGIDDASSVAAEDWYSSRAREEIARDPLGALGRVPLKLASWWAPDFFLPRHLLRDWYGPVAPTAAVLLVIGTWLAAAVPLLLGPASLVSLPGSRFRALSFTWLVAAAVLHVVSFGVSRMHLPYVPLLVTAVFAYRFDRDDVLSAARWWRKGGPAFALAIAAWIISAPAVAGVYVCPGPRHVGAARWLGAVGETPLPASRHAAWMRAEVVAAAGDPAAANRLLRDSRHADDAWSLVLRATFVTDAEERRALMSRAVAADPRLGIWIPRMIGETP